MGTCNFPEHHKPPSSGSDIPLLKLAGLLMVLAFLASASTVMRIVSDVLIGAGITAAVLVTAATVFLVWRWRRRRARVRALRPAPMVTARTTTTAVPIRPEHRQIPGLTGVPPQIPAGTRRTAGRGRWHRMAGR